MYSTEILSLSYCLLSTSLLSGPLLPAGIEGQQVTPKKDAKDFFLAQQSTRQSVMMKPMIWGLMSLAAASGGLPAAAHGPTPHKIDETVEIAAKPDVVWALIADFSALSKWHPLVSESVPQEEPVQGKLRVPTLKSGATLMA
jgi:Polyketide cyclase / dehydrase and lipid transport